jgi:hypothetical protein
MQLVIEVNNPKKLDFLLELLRSFDYVKNIHLADVSNKHQTGNNASFFEKYYGSQKSGVSMNDVDQKLNSLRAEWERDIS